MKKWIVVVIMFLTAVGRVEAIHPIQVRQAADGSGGEFYDTRTNKKFIPRGNNYVRLTKFLDPINGCESAYHSTFNVEVNNGCDTYHYDPNESETQLRMMSQSGYNVVRVFINERLIGNAEGGLDKLYLKNVSDFIKRAKNYNIFVMLTASSVPIKGGYAVTTDRPDWFGGVNKIYLDKSGPEVKGRYYSDLIYGLKELGTPLEAIFGYSIENELYFSEKQPPFSLTSGWVKTADGVGYDMGSSAAREKMIDKNTVNYVNNVKQAIVAADPGSLVTVGFFNPTAGENQGRPVSTFGVIADPENGGSNLDFVDLHAYTTVDGDLTNLINSFRISSNKKPMVMGEFGAYKSRYPTINGAAEGLKKWQVDSCKSYIVTTADNFKFNGFSGWFLWDWDRQNDNIWTALEGQNIINNALKPNLRANPCVAAEMTPIPTSTLTPTAKNTPTMTLTPTAKNTPTATLTPTLKLTPTFTPAITKLGDYNKDNKIDLMDFGTWKTQYLVGQKSLADFVVWKKAYLGNP